jgi:hypothetical protein
MRFKTGFVVGGIFGYLAGKEMAKRTMTPSDQRSPVVRAAMDRHPSTRFQGLTDRASAVGLEAVRRARASIQKRLVADVDDLSMN